VRLGYAPSRRAAAELISHGRVRVNGRRFRKGGSIAVGDSVEVADAPAGRAIEPNPDLKIAILFEDAGNNIRKKEIKKKKITKKKKRKDKKGKIQSILTKKC